MPKPVVSYISPIQCNAGTSSVTLQVYGQGFDNNTMIVFGNTSLSTNFVGINRLNAVIPSSLIANGILGNVSVTVTNLYGASNANPFSITPPSSSSLADLSNIVSGIDLSSVSSISNTSNGFQKVINNVQTYTVQQNDSLQSIAQNVLGDASQWLDIAFINNLRYPFISSDSSDLNGTNSNTTTNLTRQAKLGDQFVYLNNLSQNLQSGAVLYFDLVNSKATSNLTNVSEIHPIVQVTPNSYNYEVRVDLDLPLENTYLAGTELSILTTYNNTTSRVVKAGDAILLPSNINNASVIKTNNTNSTDPNIFLGQDLLLDDNGNLASDLTGDLSGVSGIANLRQALSDRLKTEVGELVYYPYYGNPLIDYIGTLNGSSLAIIANDRVSKSLLQDPRVDSVSSISTTVLGDGLTVNVDLKISSTAAQATFDFILNK